MTQVKNGDTVRIHYTGTLLGGGVFDSSSGRDPPEFKVGSGHVVSGLDVAMPGMAVSDKKTVNAVCKQAYGPINPGLHQTVSREAIPSEIALNVGMQLQMQAPEGQVLQVNVVEVNEEVVALDANHALAGQDLIFGIELVSIS